MILFNDERLLMHNPKTAGTSLIAYLQSNLPGDIRLAGVRELGTNHPSISMALGYARDATGRRQFKILSTIRNPFDREVSLYHYCRDVLSASPSLAVDLPDLAIRRYVHKCAELDFKAYLRLLWEENGSIDIWRSRCYYQITESEANDLNALYILRFEHLETDVANAFGLDHVYLPRLNAGNRGPTADYYDRETIRLVGQSYEWMFEAGYYDLTVTIR